MTSEQTTARSRKTPGRVRYVSLVTVGLTALLAGCEAGAPNNRSGDGNTTQPTVSPSPRDQYVAFPTEAFAEISEGPVPEETATTFPEVLADVAGTGGMSTAPGGARREQPTAFGDFASRTKSTSAESASPIRVRRFLRQQGEECMPHPTSLYLTVR